MAVESKELEIGQEEPKSRNEETIETASLPGNVEPERRESNGDASRLFSFSKGSEPEQAIRHPFIEPGHL
jgi:hypothetical protein